MNLIKRTLIKSKYLIQIVCLFLIFSFETIAQIDFRNIHIVSQVNNEKVATDKSRIVDSGDVVRLYLVLEARVEDLFSSIYITLINSISIAGDTVPRTRIKVWNFLEQSNPLIRWYRVEPEKLDTVYMNNFNNLLPWARVKYCEVPIPEWNDRWSVLLKSLNNVDDFSPGTIWFKAEIAFQGQFVSTPGVESRYIVMSGDYGGLSEDVFRLTVKGRSGNRFVDYLLTFRNIPYIENTGSWNNCWEEHQTVEWIGGDLQTFIVRAAELAGRPLIKYLNKIPVPELNFFEITDYYSRMALLSSGNYITMNDEPVYLNKYAFDIGDFIVKGSNCAIMYKDRSPVSSKAGGNPNRRLDESDLILQVNKRSMEIVPIGEALGDSLILIRWKKRW
ncbi:MAG: hypothetical protein DRP89_07870 [Candidatus Neomarinimicrobiota bacterium]|nr:MAG: hypothetical protein DRP89_07870 [Candidatus Neomarinimicrobiota bacterium]